MFGRVGRQHHMHNRSGLTMCRSEDAASGVAFSGSLSVFRRGMKMMSLLPAMMRCASERNAVCLDLRVPEACALCRLAMSICNSRPASTY